MVGKVAAVVEAKEAGKRKRGEGKRGEGKPIVESNAFRDDGKNRRRRRR